MTQKISRTQVMKYWVPVIGYATGIFFLSSLSPTGVNIPTFFYGFDKMIHAIEYAIFGILLFRAFRYATLENIANYASLFAVAVAVVYGISDEFHQSFVPLRHADGWDVLADAVGAFLGVRIWNTFFLASDPIYSSEVE